MLLILKISYLKHFVQFDTDRKPANKFIVDFQWEAYQAQVFNVYINDQMICYYGFDYQEG